MKKCYLFFLLCTIILIPHAFADDEVSIQTKSTYYYGEFLSFTINVSKISGDSAIIKIIDQNQRSSSPINIAIKNNTTTMTAPFPFESTIFDEGEYTIEVQYGNYKDITRFTLQDSGDVVIPYVTKDISAGWIQGLISDHDFVKYFIDQKLLFSSNLESKINNNVTIPSWVKSTTQWWSDGFVSDKDYLNGLQFLINRGIINLNSNY